MGAARKFWQEAKGNCPEWKDENLKEDLGPLLDKVEDALATLASTGGKLLPLVEKAHDRINGAKRIGERYKNELTSLSPWSDIRAFFESGVAQAVRKLGEQQAQLVDRPVRQAASDLNDCTIALSAMD